jgi:hypothetical protein
VSCSEKPDPTSIAPPRDELPRSGKPAGRTFHGVFPSPVVAPPQGAASRRSGRRAHLLTRNLATFLEALQHTLCAPTQSRAAPSCPPHLARNHLFTPSKTAVLPLLWCQNTGRRAQNKHLRRCPSIASQHVSGSAPLSIAQQDPSLHSTQQQRESAPMIPSSALRCGGKTTSWGGSAQAHSWNQAQLQPRGIPWSRTARPEVS